MLSFALEYQEALKQLTSDLSNGLRSFELDDMEWELAAELAEILKVRRKRLKIIIADVSHHAQYLKDGTLFFSRDSPNLQKVLPAMDKIDDYFTNRLNDQSLNVAIRAAMISAKATLNKYYELTDDAEVYRIAIGKCNSVSYQLSVTYFIPQSWILVTNFGTSKKLVGTIHGFTHVDNWSRTSLNALTLISHLPRLTRTWKKKLPTTNFQRKAK